MSIKLLKSKYTNKNGETKVLAFLNHPNHMNPVRFLHGKDKDGEEMTFDMLLAKLKENKNWRDNLEYGSKEFTNTDSDGNQVVNTSEFYYLSSLNLEEVDV